MMTIELTDMINDRPKRQRLETGGRPDPPSTDAHRAENWCGCPSGSC
jgi:hypothetical protein